MTGATHVLAIDTSHTEREIQGAIRAIVCVLGSSMMSGISHCVLKAATGIQERAWVDHLRLNLSAEQFAAIVVPFKEAMSKAEWDTDKPPVSAGVHRQADGSMAVGYSFNADAFRMSLRAQGVNAGSATFPSHQFSAQASFNVPSPLVTVSQPNVNVFEQPKPVATKQTFERDADGELLVATSRPIYSEEEVAP